MSIESMYRELSKYPEHMDFQPPVNEEEINNYQKKTGLLFPEDLKTLFRLFNGGEIFVPGTTIFGFSRRGKVPSLQEANANKEGGKDSVLNQYLVFAMLNFGDYICIDTRGSGRLIQWNHENGGIEAEWACLEDWLADEIHVNESIMGKF